MYKSYPSQHNQCTMETSIVIPVNFNAQLNLNRLLTDWQNKAVNGSLPDILSDPCHCCASCFKPYLSSLYQYLCFTVTQYKSRLYTLFDIVGCIMITSMNRCLNCNLHYIYNALLNMLHHKINILA